MTKCQVCEKTTRVNGRNKIFTSKYPDLCVEHIREVAQVGFGKTKENYNRTIEILKEKYPTTWRMYL